MTSPRQWAAIVLAGGVVLGAALDERPAREVPRADGYWILSGDFHVHAALGDGTLLPWELRREARRAGLDVIAVTNHNTTFAARFASWWARSVGGPWPLVIAGEEITSPDYHMVAVGIRRTVSRRQPAASAISQVHAQGGVAIAAHPSAAYWSGYDGTAMTGLDGVEVANDTDPFVVAEYAEFAERARARNADLAAIGSSDFHGSPAMGRCRTYLFVREQSEAGILDAIRNGRTVAADDRGNLSGDPALVRLVEVNTPQGRSDRNRGWRRLSVALAWIGLLGLMLLRGSAR